MKEGKIIGLSVVITLLVLLIGWVVISNLPTRLGKNALGQLNTDNGLPILANDYVIKTIDNNNGTITMYYNGGAIVTAILPNK